MTILLAQRPMRGDAALMDLSHLIADWTRSASAIGGYDRGTGTLTAPRERLTDWYNTWLGRQVVEYAYGLECWRGYISELRLTLNGVEYFQSLAPDWFHNTVTAYYSSDIGERSTTSTYENTDSQAEFGTLEHNVFLAGATATSAAALAQTHLAQYGWPRSRMAGGAVITEQQQTGADGLQIVCSGFWHTLNWSYKSATSTQAADLHIADAVAAAEFVTAGRIDDNDLSVRVDCYPNPRRWLDVVTEVTEQGDASYNAWRCGVYEDRKLYYEAAPTAVGYHLANGKLRNGAGAPVVPELLKPGFLLRNTDAPIGNLYVSGSVWGDPQVSYVGQVVYDHASRALTLNTQNVAEGLVAIQARIGGGSA